MVYRMSVSHAPQPRESCEEGHRQPAVNEAVVNDHVREAEGSHAAAGTDGDRRQRAVEVAAQHHEEHRDGRVSRRERVVQLEASLAARVMRAMDAPEPMVPHATVEEPRPGLHRAPDDAGDHRADEHPLERGHEVTS
jgi:hypothetical protein